jgi:hypothetical protein
MNKLTFGLISRWSPSDGHLSKGCAAPAVMKLSASADSRLHDGDPNQLSDNMVRDATDQICAATRCCAKISRYAIAVYRVNPCRIFHLLLVGVIYIGEQ